MSQALNAYYALCRASTMTRNAHVQDLNPRAIQPRARVEEIRRGNCILVSVKARDDFGSWRSLPDLDRTLRELDYLSENHIAINYLDGTITKYTNQKTVITDHVDYRHGRWVLFARTSSCNSLLHKRRVPMVTNSRVLTLAKTYAPDLNDEIIRYVANQVKYIVDQVAHDQNRMMCSRNPETQVRDAFELAEPGIQWYIDECLFEDASPPKAEAETVQIDEPIRVKTVTKHYTATVIKKVRAVA